MSLTCTIPARSGTRKPPSTGTKPAYRRGDARAASHIGTIWRDKGNFARALYRFNRAVQMNAGDYGDADLEIAQPYLRENRDRGHPAVLLKGACNSEHATENRVGSKKTPEPNEPRSFVTASVCHPLTSRLAAAL